MRARQVRDPWRARLLYRGGRGRHFARARPLGGLYLTRDLTEGGALTRWLRGQPAWRVVEAQTVGGETGE